MRVGILGGGQLGRLMVLAGYPLGVRFKHIGTAQDTSAGQVSEQVTAAYEDTEALIKFAEGLDVITYESENVPIDAARILAEFVPVRPPIAALEASQDRLTEKLTFAQLGIPTAPYAEVGSFDELEDAAARIGYPAVLKTRLMVYDGKGQFVLRNADELNMAWKLLGAGGALILEGLVPFDRELSIIAVRSRTGQTLFYPLIENQHADGILRASYAPAPDLNEGLQSIAEDYATRVLESLDYVGTLAIELFQVNSQLVANEMAPRVHNSGHWTSEGAETSQFENHIRAILGYPLGSTASIGHCAMINLIGVIPPVDYLLQYPQAHLHLYGKSARPGRKLGHVTVRSDDVREVRKIAEKIRAELHRLTKENKPQSAVLFYED